MIVEIHGGPTSSTWYRMQFWIYGRTLAAANGYALLSPNYRGSVGYGDAFLTDLIGRENDIEVKDILAGVDAMVERGIADRVSRLDIGARHRALHNLSTEQEQRLLGTVVSDDGLVIFDGSTLSTDDSYSSLSGMSIRITPTKTEVFTLDDEQYEAEYLGVDRFTKIGFLRISDAPDGKFEPVKFSGDHSVY